MPSTELIFRKRALPITKPDALPFFGDGFLEVMGRILARTGLNRTWNER